MLEQYYFPFAPNYSDYAKQPTLKTIPKKVKREKTIIDRILELNGSKVCILLGTDLLPSTISFDGNLDELRVPEGCKISKEESVIIGPQNNERIVIVPNEKYQHHDADRFSKSNQPEEI